MGALSYDINNKVLDSSHLCDYNAIINLRMAFVFMMLPIDFAWN